MAHCEAQYMPKPGVPRWPAFHYVSKDARLVATRRYRRTDAGQEYDMSILALPKGWEDSLNDVYWAEKVGRELVSDKGLGSG